MPMKPLTRPLDNSLIPENDAARVLINHRAAGCITALEKLGINAVKVYDNPAISGSVSSHADMNYFYYGKGNLFACKSQPTGEWQEKFNTITTGEPENDSYPFTVKLNCVRLSGFLICNTKTVSEEILQFAYNDNLTVIDVKQGFTKCSICVINDRTIITDDASIYKQVSKYIDDVTLVTKGSIKLEGMNYGFIGGCTGLIGKDKLAVTGRLDSHIDHNLIYNALSRNNISAVELTNDILEDIGSILPVEEFFAPDTSNRNIPVIH